MSDFGTVITITKQDGTFSGDEISALTTELDEILQNEDYVNALGEPFQLELKEVENEPSLLLLILSEHYYGGDEEEDEETFQFVEESEVGHAENIAGELQRKFNGYTFTASIEEW